MANDFDDFQHSAQEQGKPAQTGGERKSFSNELGHSDSLTVANAYVHEIRKHGDNIFVSLGLQVGRRRKAEGSDDYETVYQFVDVLAGRTIRKSLEVLVGTYDKDRGRLYARVEIRNLTFGIGDQDPQTGKHWLDTRGILETLKLGFID